MPKFSVVIPAYNCSHLIHQAVDSVLHQNFNDFEILIVDDGSIDDTQKVVQKYLSSEKLRYIYQKNAGPGAARNNGIRNATGEYIIFLDSDDVFYQTCVESLAGFLDRNSNVDFLFTNYDIFDENGVINSSGIDSWRIFRNIHYHVVGDDEWIFSESLSMYIIQYGGFMHTSGVTIKRKIFEEIGYFEEGYCYGEDDELYARATYRSVSGYIDRVLSRKRNHSASLIHNPDKKLRNARDYLDLTRHQLEYYQDDHEISEIVQKKVERLAYDYCWCLNESGRLNEARQEICSHLRERVSWPLVKLLVKNFLLKINVT